MVSIESDRRCGRARSSRLVWPGLLALALALAAAGCSKPSGFKGYKPAKLEHADEAFLNRIVLTPEAETRLDIQTAKLALQSVPRRRSVGGEVVAAPGKGALVTAPVSGTVQPPRRGESLPLPGTALTAGQVVMRFAPLVAPGRNVRVDAQRDVESARSRAETARRQAQRLAQLGQEGIGNRSAFEAADTEARIAEAELAAAQARLQRVSGKDALAADVAMPLSAPQTSVLLRLWVTQGQAVAQDTPLFEMADLRTVWIRVPVYVGDLPSLERARPATVRGLGMRADSAGVEATAVVVPPVGRPETASAELFYEVQQSEPTLTPGQRVLVSLPLHGDNEERKVIPHAAVLYDLHGSAWAYARVGEHSYERRPITVDHVQDSLAVLARGPEAGTEVVTSGATELFGTEFGAGK